MKKKLWLVGFLFSLTCGAAVPLLHVGSSGHYLEDPTGKPVFLCGTHRGYELEDYSNLPPFDWGNYLSVVSSYGVNAIRMWQNDAISTDKGQSYVLRLPFARTGPAVALDGGLAFDLTSPNSAFFSTLSSRVAQAGLSNIYCQIMLHEGWMIYGQGASYWPWAYYNTSNNVNGILSAESDLFTLNNSKMVAIDDAFVKAVVDTVNSFDNVLYEVANESPCYTSPWQTHVVTLIKSYEAGKPKQHPVGMTSFWPNSTGAKGNSLLQQSPADWISLYGGGQGNEPESGAFRTNPPPIAGTAKVQFLDTDHLQGFATNPDEKYYWAWKAFTRGYNLLLLGETDATTRWDILHEFGVIKSYADKMNLGAMNPSTTLSTTGYALENPGVEYLVYQPDNKKFTVSVTSGNYYCEWFDPATYVITPIGIVRAKSTQFSMPNSSKGAVLYMKRQ